MITFAYAAAPQTLRWCPRIRDAYVEMPGLNLTLSQASRLWGVEPRLCREALDVLVAAGFLVRAGDRYLRADSPWCDIDRRG